MLGSYPTSWKEPYRQALKESDEQKLTELVQAAEYAIVLRLQELVRYSSDWLVWLHWRVLGWLS